MAVKEIIAGAVVTMVVGGTAYTVSKADVVDNFADDTGMTQQQAEEYVNGVGEDDLVPYDKLGADWVTDGNDVLGTVAKVDCVNFQYEWESDSLTCDQGKTQIFELGNDEVSLGNSYIKLSSDSASKADITTTIGFIDEVNSDYESGIVKYFLDASKIDETKKSNSYNKANLQAALESDQ